MAPLSKYAAALAFFLSSISAIPLDVVNDVASSADASILKDLAENADAPYILSSDVGNLTAHFNLEKRQSGDCGVRPANSICGPDFVDMASKGWGPAVAAMPQFNHAHFNSLEQSCYPDNGANVNNDGPATGLEKGELNPPVGSGCRHPTGGAGTGPLQRSLPFPVYVDGVYCPGDTTWRIIYNVYYPKDYGHRHDWENVIVVFGKGDTGDWWERRALFLSQHKTHNRLRWNQATAHDDAYSGSPNRGANGAHPRVFVGMYKHAMFNEAKTDCAGPLCSVGDQEYRRNSWQFTPVASDIRNGVVDIPQAWGDYGGKSPPWTMVPKVCGMSMP